jgi:hypothetical protein
LENNKNKAIILLTALILLLSPNPVSADVGVDHFRMILDEDDIGVGGTLRLILYFENPDNTEDVNLELEVLAGGQTVYLDRNYPISFHKGVDKTITLRSTNFPGPDLPHDFWNSNLMNWLCGDVEITVSLRGIDLTGDLEDRDTLRIGRDDGELTLIMAPSNPLIDDNTVLTVYDDLGDKLRNARVKVTWVDDREGSLRGRWDSRDKSWEGRTDENGELTFKLSDKFPTNAVGIFQIDVFKSRYCLLRKTIEVSNEIAVDISPKTVAPGQEFSVCAKNPNSDPLTGASVYVRGPGYSKTFYTAQDGCETILIEQAGTYLVSVTKQPYPSSIGHSITISQAATTTTATSTSSTTSTTTPPAQKQTLYITPDTQSAEVGRQIKITLTDDKDNRVTEANITVTPSGLTGEPDVFGTFTFTVDEPGIQRVKVESEGFYPSQETVEFTNRHYIDPDFTAPPKDESKTIILENPILLGLSLTALIVLLSTAAVIIYVRGQWKAKKAKTGLFGEKQSDSGLGGA